MCVWIRTPVCWNRNEGPKTLHRQTLGDEDCWSGTVISGIFFQKRRFLITIANPQAHWLFSILHTYTHSQTECRFWLSSSKQFRLPLGRLLWLSAQLVCLVVSAALAICHLWLTAVTFLKNHPPTTALLSMDPPMTRCSVQSVLLLLGAFEVALTVIWVLWVYDQNHSLIQIYQKKPLKCVGAEPKTWRMCGGVWSRRN